MPRGTCGETGTFEVAGGAEGADGGVGTRWAVKSLSRASPLSLSCPLHPQGLLSLPPREGGRAALWVSLRNSAFTMNSPANGKAATIAGSTLVIRPSSSTRLRPSWGRWRSLACSVSRVSPPFNGGGAARGRGESNGPSLLPWSGEGEGFRSVEYHPRLRICWPLRSPLLSFISRGSCVVGHLVRVIDTSYQGPLQP
jgi:hypothetical protein